MLRVVYTLGWLPALITATIARRAAGPSHVLSGAGDAGRLASLGLAASLVLLGAAYIAALRRPPTQRVLLVTCAASILVVLALPVLFSADVYAYAYYGDLALHGRNPYGHDRAIAGDALAAAAVRAWDGHVPPRCVYGPLAVAIAAVADAAGAVAGAGGQIAAQCLAALGAYAVYVFCALRLVRGARERAALVLNPVVIWSVTEGHNDAAMVALVFAGLLTARYRPLLLACAALIKAPAFLAFAALRRESAPLVPAWTTLGALAVAAGGYLPLAFAFASAARSETAAASSAWQSPLGILAAATGRIPAIALAIAALAAATLAIRRVAPAQRAAALTLAAWFTLPNAYPWYAFWIVPIAARRLNSIWSRALLVASVCAAARAMSDAIFAQPRTFDAARTFHGWMIALEFLPPLCFLAAVTLRRRGAIAAGAIAVAALCCVPADAQMTTPQPAPPIATPPFPVATTTPTPAPVSPPTTVAPAFATPVPGTTTAPAPIASPAPAPVVPSRPAPVVTAPPGATVPPLPAPVASAAPVTAGSVVPAPAAVPSPVANPYTYVITPPPGPITTPDGPHIVEVFVNDRRVRAGGPISVRVLTSPNVVGVEARALGRFIAIPQSNPGLFSLAFTIPNGIPFWLLNRNYDIVIAAATSDGRQVTVSFPMLLTR